MDRRSGALTSRFQRTAHDGQQVRGQFSEYDANVTIADDPSQSRVDATVQIASIDTHDANRDGHLRSGEFFDIETHPR